MSGPGSYVVERAFVDRTLGMHAAEASSPAESGEMLS